MIARTIVLAVILVLLGTAAYADECNSARYVDNGDWTVTDCRTGLTWLLDANCKDTSSGIDKSNGSLTWYEALKWVAGLQDGICNLTDSSAPGDWRLPTKTEWMAMIASAKQQNFTLPTLTNATGTGQWAQANIFLNVQSSAYWSSTTRGITSDAWFVDLFDGDVFYYPKSFSILVWPVRGGQSGEFGSITIQ